MLAPILSKLKVNVDSYEYEKNDGSLSISMEKFPARKVKVKNFILTHFLYRFLIKVLLESRDIASME